MSKKEFWAVYERLLSCNGKASLLVNHDYSEAYGLSAMVVLALERLFLGIPIMFPTTTICRHNCLFVTIRYVSLC